MATHLLGQVVGQALLSDTGKIGPLEPTLLILLKMNWKNAEPTAGTQLAKTCLKERNDYENAKFTET